MRSFLSITAALIFLLPATMRAADQFKLHNGDRVVFLGNTLIEREQRSGWWELALTTPGFPDKKVQFRNLGWSGDTVFGESHVGFAFTRSGSANVGSGYKHLIEHTLHLKPTVLIIGYGANESFEGEKGLPRFVKGFNTLLDALAPAKARVVLLSPLRQGDMGRPLPDPAAHNKDLRLYADAIRDVAQKRGCLFVDLYDRLGDIGTVNPAVTENGIHLTDRGYRWSARKLEEGLGIPTYTFGPTVLQAMPKNAAGPVRFELCNLRLERERTIAVTGLRAGKHTLTIDGKAVATADAAQWAKGVMIDSGPEVEQLDKLRKTIVAKNELYFHRWRPQNETYLFGFRKHEQGNNAVEIPRFDPLIAAKEKEISELSVARDHTYVWTLSK